MNNYPQRCLASTICRRLAALIAPMLLAPCFAAADTITTFDVSGTCVPFAPFTGTTFSGTLTIDVTAGTVTAIDVSFLGLSPFTTISSSDPVNTSDWDVHSTDAGGSLLILNFTTGHTPGSLVGFTGGTILGGGSNVLDGRTGHVAYIIDSGTITAPEGVPDGGTTVMLLGPALGALGIARRFAMS